MRIHVLNLVLALVFFFKIFSLYVFSKSVICVDLQFLLHTTFLAVLPFGNLLILFYFNPLRLKSKAPWISQKLHMSGEHSAFNVYSTPLQSCRQQKEMNLHSKDLRLRSGDTVGRRARVCWYCIILKGRPHTTRRRNSFPRVREDPAIRLSRAPGEGPVFVDIILKGRPHTTRGRKSS